MLYANLLYDNKCVDNSVDPTSEDAAIEDAAAPTNGKRKRSSTDSAEHHEARLSKFIKDYNAFENSTATSRPAIIVNDHLRGDEALPQAQSQPCHEPPATSSPVAAPVHTPQHQNYPTQSDQNSGSSPRSATSPAMSALSALSGPGPPSPVLDHSVQCGPPSDREVVEFLIETMFDEFVLSTMSSSACHQAQENADDNEAADLEDLMLRLLATAGVQFINH